MRHSSFLVLLLLAHIAWAAPTAPLIEGKTAAQWIQQLRTGNRDQWNRAADVLMMNGDRAIAPLTAALKDKDERVRRGAAQGLRQLTSFPAQTLQALRECLQDPSLAVRSDVVETLLYAHDYDAPLPEALRTVLNAPSAELRQRQGYVLMILPLQVKPYLGLVLETLKNPDPIVRTDAAEALCYDEDPTGEIAPALRAALDDPIAAVRLAAAEAYWQLAEDATPLVELLVQAMVSAPAATDRARAAGVLGEIGRAAGSTFAALTTAALQDPDADVRKAAAGALPKLRAASDVALPIYVRLMQDKRQSGWEGALQGLVNLGPAAAPVLPTLLPQLLIALRGDHIFSSVPELAATAVGMIGPPARAAVPLLVRLANLPYQDPGDGLSGPPPPPKGVDPFSISCNSGTQQAALIALAQVASLQEALPHLLKALESKDETMVVTAAGAIGSFGPAARAALVPLLHAIVTENDKVYYMDLNEALFKAIISIDPKALPGNLIKIAQKRPAALSDLHWLAPEISNPEDYVAPLIRIVQKPPSERAASAAAGLLTAFGARAPEAAEALGRLLIAKDPHLQMEASEALGAMGTAAQPALPYLLPLLKSADEFTRFGAVQIVEAIGPGAVSAAPILLELVRNPKLEVPEKVSAAWAIKSVGADTQDLIAPLTEILDQPEAKTAGGAAELLGEVGPPAASAVPSLRKRLADSKPYSRVQVARALWRLTGDIAGVLPAISEVARGELSPARITAVLLLGEIGPPAAAGTRLLRELLVDPSPTVRMAAALSLAQIARDSSGLAATIVEALRPPPTDFVDEMMLQPMLGPALQPFAADLVGPLTDALKSTTDENYRLELVVFLPLLGEAAKAAEAELEKLVAADRTENPGAAALQALLTIRGKQRRPDMSVLMRCFGDDMPWRFPVPD